MLLRLGPAAIALVRNVAGRPHQGYASKRFVHFRTDSSRASSLSSNSICALYEDRRL